MATLHKISQYAATLSSLYYKLLLLVGGSGAGKTKLLKEICANSGGNYLNLNLALAAKLKEIPLAERCYHIDDFIDEILRSYPGDLLMLDNIEILFSRHLQIDPLRTLKNISKYRKAIAAWPGIIEDGYLIYAEPWHKDCVKYPISELECLYINLERGT